MTDTWVDTSIVLPLVPYHTVVTKDRDDFGQQSINNFVTMASTTTTTKIDSNDDAKENKEGSTDTESLLSVFELPETPDEFDLAPGQRVVAIGDIHGDFSMLILCLLAANLISKSTDTDDDDDNEERTKTMNGIGLAGTRFSCKLVICSIAATMKSKSFVCWPSWVARRNKPVAL